MRVLLVHNRYQQRGGEDTVFAAEAQLLESHGHDVARLVVSNDAIPAHPGPRAAAGLAMTTVWSRDGVRRIRDAIRARRPDVVHFHNTFPLLSPAACRAAHEAGIPVVLTLHNYRLLCPNASFYRDGRVCEDCLGRAVTWPGVRHACYRDSRAQSAAVTAMLAAHRFLGTWRVAVDRFVALSEFSRRKFVAGGLPEAKIVVKPNFVAGDPGPRGDDRGDFLFVGRLAPNKGIEPMLDAWAGLGACAPLTVFGSGPLEARVRAAVDAGSGLRYAGWMEREDVLGHMRSSRALVFPSLWYEGFPMTLVEAFACGLPVLASRLGAIPEIVEDGVTGLLFEPGDPADLAAKVRWATEHPDELRRMGAAARRIYEARYTAERNYTQLLAIYGDARARATA